MRVSSSVSRCSTQRSSSGISATGTRSASVKPSQRAQHPAQRVAQPAIELRLLLQDFRADAQIFGGVRHHHPQAQNVGAVLVRDFLRGHHVAERFRHFAALLVHHEAVRQHRLERRPAACADRFQQRGLEPAAMLVRAFQIEIGRPGQGRGPPARRHGSSRIRTRHPRCRAPARNLGVAVVAQETGWRRGKPGVGAFRRERLHDARNHRGVAQRFAGRLSTNTAIGTPQARWRLMHQSGRASTMRPMRLRPDSGTNAVASMAASAFRRMPFRSVHADEPLRRGAEDQRRLGSPGMRIGMQQPAAREQPAGLGQGGADRIIGLVDVHAGKQRHPGVETTVAADGIGDFQPVRAAEDRNLPRHGRARYARSRCRLRW